MKTKDVPFNLYLRFHKKRLGLSINKFAERFGVSPSSVCKWKREKNPTVPKLNAEIGLRARIEAAQPEEAGK